MKERKKPKTKRIDQILIALEVLIKDDFKTEERLDSVEKQLKDIKSVLTDLLQYYKDISDFENKVFKK